MAVRCLLLAVVLLCLMTAYIVRYRAFVTSLRSYGTAVKDGFALRDFPMLDRHQITQIGMAHRPGSRPESSYTLFEHPKAVDSIRIGVFGCSFVAGSEAGPGQDFPSHLQRLFVAEGDLDVEVLNFGVGAFGVQQSFLLWQYLSGSFDLDITIYNMYGFHRFRDTTFIMTNSIYAPVHARYVLEGDGLALVEAPGDDRREASAGYFRLLPKWRYLRYDTKTPPQIRALLPAGRELTVNPLYYHPKPEFEVTDVYRRIFTEMASGSRALMVLVNDPRSREILPPGTFAPGATSVRTSSKKYTADRSWVFRAPKNHPSALGYAAMAKEAHAIIVGRDHAQIPEIEIDKAMEEGPEGDLTIGLSSFDDVILSFGDQPAALFTDSIDEVRARPYSFSASGKDSIVDVSGRMQSVLMALDGLLTEPAVRLRFEVDGRPINVELGVISTARGGYAGVLDCAWKTIDGDGWRLDANQDTGAIYPVVTSRQEITDVRLEVGELTVLTGAVVPYRRSESHRLRWESAAGDLLTTRGHPNLNATEILGTDGGGYCITALRGDASESVCTRTWRLESTDITVPSSGLPPIREPDWCGLNQLN